MHPGFFEQPADRLAPQLLGYELLVSDEMGVKTGGVIIETEAYTGEDEASHCFKGETKRNAAMFDTGGTIYVYFTYGMHLCINIVSGPMGRGEGVLIRAIEPTVGMADMWQRRFKSAMSSNPPHEKLVQLTNGPAKLAQALAISLTDNHQRIGERRFYLVPRLPTGSLKITQTTRVGIKKAVDAPWRWYIEGNAWVSKKAKV